ncbi:MAG: hypothetical protein AAGH88_05070 [Planctomycetota bacterium]
MHQFDAQRLVIGYDGMHSNLDLWLAGLFIAFVGLLYGIMPIGAPTTDATPGVAEHGQTDAALSGITVVKGMLLSLLAVICIGTIAELTLQKRHSSG